MHINTAHVLTSNPATILSDLLTGNIEPDVLNRATIVAIKGKLHFEAIQVATGVKKVRALFGLIVGSNTLVAATMPDLILTSVSQGWMFRTSFRGASLGDASIPTWISQSSQELNVKSKRKLKGIGQQTLFAVTKCMESSDLSNLEIDISVLLHVP